MTVTNIMQSVAILCDGNNIERSIHEESGSPSTMINFDELIPRLLSGRGLKRLIYFREGKNISSKLAQRLHQKYYGSVVPCHKSADIPLSIKATQLASKIDTIVILSGDSDYIELVRHLKSEGVRVEIAAVEKTTARILKDEADYFHPITKKDWFTLSRPNPGARRKAFVNNHKKPETKPALRPFQKPTTTAPVSKKPALTAQNIIDMTSKETVLPNINKERTPTPPTAKTPLKKPAVKKTTTKKPAVKKAPVKKPIAKPKAPAKKTTKKPAAKKASTTKTIKKTTKK